MKVLVIFTKLALLSIIVYLVPQGVDLWDSRDLSFRMKRVSVVSAPRQLERLAVDRNTLSEEAIDSITSQNLFRKQRSAYVKPVLKIAPPLPLPVKEEPEPKRFIPAPRLSLEGVVMIPGRNIAILEGQYPRSNGDSPTEYFPLRINRFILGDRIGEYRITEIERDRVILTNLEGEELKLSLDILD